MGNDIRSITCQNSRLFFPPPTGRIKVENGWKDMGQGGDMGILPYHL